MKKQDSQLLFFKLSKQNLQHLQSVGVQAECFLLKKIKNDKKIEDEAKSSHRRVKIQLRANFVLQYDEEAKAIVSGFQVDISITFKILRAPTISEDQTGAILGIQFRAEIFQNSSIFFYLLQTNQKSQKKESQKLQEFGDKLGRKYIKRDGFHDIYRAVKKIGKGVTASVYKALRLTDRQQFAVKSFKKEQYFKVDNGRGKMAFEKQFRTMTILDSDYLCRLVSVYESDNSIYIVMQLLTRSLYNHLKFKGFPSISNVKEIMAKLLIGLGQMHKKNILHRDLKLQNIMVVDVQEQKIKPIIIDFGLAQVGTNSKFLYVKCGTPGYVAPQILNIKVSQIASPPYDFKCDIFSLGVIFFILMVGRTLFEGEDQKDVVRKNKQCLIDYDFTEFNRLTEEAKVLLRKMLQKDPSQRASVNDLLHLEFFKQTVVLKDFHSPNTAVSSTLIEQKQNVSEQKQNK